MSEETHLINDLHVRSESTGGWEFVHLRDSDDGDTFMLGEDEILALHEYLGKVISEKRLKLIASGRDCACQELIDVIESVQDWSGTYVGECIERLNPSAEGAAEYCDKADAVLPAHDDLISCLS